MKSVLIVCTGNSCRSQMAEALWRAELGSEWNVYSAGTHPAGVNSMAKQVIEELGIDMSGHSSKHVNQYVDQAFDLVVTVCDGAQTRCPVFHNAKKVLHWPFEDPIAFHGSHLEVMDEFRRVRNCIQAKIREYLQTNPA